jgi:hypothetical protein
VVPTSPTHAAAALTINSQTTDFFVVVHAGIAFRYFYSPEFASVFLQIAMANGL